LFRAQISKVASQAKIIFLTQETSAEVVEEALFLGAWGYALKASAGSELVAAIEAVSRGATISQLRTRSIRRVPSKSRSDFEAHVALRNAHQDRVSLKTRQPCLLGEIFILSSV
jgi:DNA-binding NarL/FixJ family response regulator